MKLLKTGGIAVMVLLMNACAASYDRVHPEGLRYGSGNKTNDIHFEYKYNVLDGKYAKKELAKDVHLVAVKITNKSEKDLVFGKDIRLTYENGSAPVVMDKKKLYKSLRQKSENFLFYLLLTPMTFNTTSSTDGYVEETNSTPIGLFIGPGISFGNMAFAGNANKKFKNDLNEFDIQGTTIAKGRTVFGLIGIRSSSYDALKIEVVSEEGAGN